MTMTDLERERLMGLAAGQASMMKDAEHMKESMGRMNARIDDMHDYLKKMTKSMAAVTCRNEMQDERLSQLQNITASLGETVVKIDESGKRLKNISFAFYFILIVMAVLVGILGEEIIPKLFQWLWALFGI